MSDLIDRQAAIDGIEKRQMNIMRSTDLLDQMRFDGLADALDIIKLLSTAHPEPCEDAVSREVLKDGFTKMCNLICPYTKKQQHVMCGSCLMGTAFDVLEATPSVIPKQRIGKWIKTARWRNVYKCDQCGNYLDFSGVNAGRGDANFCPNCGSRNEVTE